MARVQVNNQKNKQATTPSKKTSQKTNQPVKKTVKKDVKPKREMNKKELMFYRGGMIVVFIVVVTVTVAMIVRYFANQTEEEGIYDAYTHITLTELREITLDRGDNVYGDISFFQNKDNYVDLLSVLMTHDIYYFYFYYGSRPNDDITEALENITNINDKAFFFINLEDPANAELLTDPGLMHLIPDGVGDHMLIRFYLDTQEFKWDYQRVRHILIELEKLA